jgi:predicted amidohydrolase YtcJ
MRLCVITGAVALSLLSSPLFAQEIADRIWTGGPVVTVDGKNTIAEGIAVKDGRIIAVGSTAAVMAHAGPETEMVNLAGETLSPGFVDAHSHIVQQSLKYSTVILDPYPIGDVRTIADIQAKLAERAATDGRGPGGWIFGWGYDDTGLAEQRHPTRQDLDAVSTDRPIVLMHISSHLMTTNTKALETAGITADTPNPEGGVIQREADGVTPNGVLEENAMAAMLAAVPPPSPERALEMLEVGARKYAEAGITTAQDGAAVPAFTALLKAAEAKGLLPIDVVTYAFYKANKLSVVDEVAAEKGERDQMRQGGIKLVVDGSIQGFTAYLSKPYFTPPPGENAVKDEPNMSTAGPGLILGAEYAGLPPFSSHEQAPAKTDYRGYPSMTQEEIEAWIARADAAGVQVIAHANGDAATDMIIEAVRKVRGETPRPELRTVIIHGQTMREDQLDAAKKLGLIPSFFPIHVAFWGDRHKALFLGPERAARIDPAKSALDRGMRFTLHHDAPIAGIDMLAVMSAAVNRETTGGEILGPDQRISVRDALRAVTIDAAWQYFEEDRKGSLEVGKLADMVVLSANPLEVDPGALKDIKVLETIKEGMTVFKTGG